MNELKKIRQNEGFSQVVMAKKIKVSISAYTKIESNHMKPSFNFLLKLKKAFNYVDMNNFFK